MMLDYVDLPQRSSHDSLPVRGTTLDDLAAERVRTHIEAATTRGRYSGPPDPLPFLQAHAAIAPGPDGALIPTTAGLLMFGRQPQHLLGHAVVDIGHFYGMAPLIPEVVHLEKGISGTLPEQIDHVERYLWSNTHHGFRLGDGAQRIEEHEYPRSVIRELTVNALAHRDYARYQQVTRVSLFRNRIEWDNPGRLPEGVTIATIQQAHMPRNAAILTLLYQAGYVESFGMGWDTVYQTLADEELPPPKLFETEASFIVTVYGRPRTRFLDPNPASPLTDVQQVIYDVIVSRGSVSRVELEAAIPDRSLRSLQRDLQALVDLGLVVTTGAARALRYHPAR